MSFIDTLFSTRIAFALVAFVVISVLLELLARRLLDAVAEVEATHWILQQLLVPAARALSLVAFILLSYPALFGVTTAPPLGELLAAGSMRLTTLMNVIFVLSLLLPLVPVFNRWPALVLPIQGIAAAGLVFHWWAAAQPGVEIRLWPGPVVAISLVVWAVLTHEAARHLSPRLTEKLGRLLNREGLDRLLYRSVVMVLQAPVILIYTLSLGRQLG